MKLVTIISTLIAVLTVSALSVFFITGIKEQREKLSGRAPRDPGNDPEGYDFIVVGSGSAGSVLASRLAEKYSVLLLEAGGPDDNVLLKIPAAALNLFGSQYDWNFETEPARNMNNRKFSVPRGKVLGGCSSINTMIYHRGHPKDFDSWKKLGMNKFTYNDLLPYFKKSEKNLNTTKNPYYHGFEGPQIISDPYEHQSVQLVLESMKQVGIETLYDLNEGDKQNGVAFVQVNQKNGQRFSVVDAYVRNPDIPKYLTVKLNAHVTRVLFNKKKAVGVEYSYNGQLFQVNARKEVILSAGAIQSPQILMLSGVGPKAHLQSLGIPVVHDLKGVGQNYQDHVFHAVSYQIINSTFPSVHTEFTPDNLNTWALTGSGPLTSILLEAIGFVQTPYETQENYPDLELIAGPMYYNPHLPEPPVPGDFVSIASVLLRPKSVGELKLRSADPFDKPIIQTNFLAEEYDMNVLVHGYKLAQQIFQQSPIKDFVTPIDPVYEDDEDIKAYIRHRANGFNHQMGTCKMGKKKDDAVVDDKARVYGVQNLRVIDASIFPNVVTGHPQQPIIAVAEKLAEEILKTSGKPGVSNEDVDSESQ